MCEHWIFGGNKGKWSVYFEARANLRSNTSVSVGQHKDSPPVKAAARTREDPGENSRGRRGLSRTTTWIAACCAKRRLFYFESLGVNAVDADVQLIFLLSLQVVFR